MVADTRIHVLGSFANIKLARDAVVDLIMGSPPGKVSWKRAMGKRLLRLGTHPFSSPGLLSVANNWCPAQGALLGIKNNTFYSRTWV